MEIVTSRMAWNEDILSRKGSFLQSWEWGALHEALGKKVLRIKSSSYATSLVRFPALFGKFYLYTPRGPIMEQYGKFGEFREQIIKEFSDKRCILLRIEPQKEDNPENREALRASGFVCSKSVQPRETLILDLNKKLDALMDDMEHDRKYAIRLSERRGVTIAKYENENDKEGAFGEFWGLFLSTQKRHGLLKYAEEYYRKVGSLEGECNSKIFLAKHKKKTIAAAIIVFFGDTATYLYASSDINAKLLNAPSLLLWRAICDAKENRKSFFDLWGISAENKAWAGITGFKKSFGGRTVRYIGTWQFPVNKPMYYLFRLGSGSSRVFRSFLGRLE